MRISKMMLVAVALIGSMAFADQEQEYQVGLQKWTALKTSQAPACDESVDSQDVLLGHKTPVSILILHGFSQNPQAMNEYVQFFKQYNVNILIPRLAHHFDANLRGLDQANKQDWINEAQAAYESAESLGSHVVVVGYSLGGLLASRLALNPKNQPSLAALVLLSPALRLQGNVELGASVASMFSKTGNDWLKMAPPACGSATPYLSVNAGNQVVSLMRTTDPTYPATDGTAYKQIFATELDSARPVFLSVVKNDEVVDSAALERMVTPIPHNGYITFLEFENSDKTQSAHSTLTLPGVEDRTLVPNDSHTPYHKSLHIFDQMQSFLKDWVGLAPAIS